MTKVCGTPPLYPALHITYNELYVLFVILHPTTGSGGPKREKNIVFQVLSFPLIAKPSPYWIAITDYINHYIISNCILISKQD